MNPTESYWQELTRGQALLAVGVPCLFLGFFLWRINSALKQAFQHRESYAQNLRRAGRVSEADAMERETSGLARRVPLYGKGLVLVGLGLCLAGIIRW